MYNIHIANHDSSTTTARAENIIRVWSIDDKGVSKAVIDFETILKDINDIDTCIRANGMLSIASASDDGKLRLWNVNFQ